MLRFVWCFQCSSLLYCFALLEEEEEEEALLSKARLHVNMP